MCGVELEKKSVFRITMFINHNMRQFLACFQTKIGPFSLFQKNMAVRNQKEALVHCLHSHLEIIFYFSFASQILFLLDTARVGHLSCFEMTKKDWFTWLHFEKSALSCFQMTKKGWFTWLHSHSGLGSLIGTLFRQSLITTFKPFCLHQAVSPTNPRRVKPQSSFPFVCKCDK